MNRNSDNCRYLYSLLKNAFNDVISDCNLL